MYDAFKLIVTAFLLPPGGPIVLVALGVLAWRRRPRLGRALCATGALALWLASLPIVAAALVTALGGSIPLDLAAAKKADAIVILGGGVRRQAAEYGGDTLGRLTLECTRYGAFLARQTGVPVLVMGGSPKEGVRPEADLMREALESEYGVQVRWAENTARNTRENAVKAAALLQAEGRRRIVLVLHGFDVRRTQRLFENAGLQVTAAPTGVPRWDTPLGAGDFLPSVAALYTSFFALYEMLASGRDAAVALITG